MYRHLSVRLLLTTENVTYKAKDLADSERCLPKTKPILREILVKT